METIMPTYKFTVELQGEGQTPEEAWQEAIDSFALDPGEPLETSQDDDDFTGYPEDDDDTDTMTYLDAD